MPADAPPTGVAVTGSMAGRAGEVLTERALSFLAGLHRAFDHRRRELLTARERVSLASSAVKKAAFARDLRRDFGPDWRIGEIPADLLDRRVEITGPVDRKMIINALNSGAKVFMADFEDATTPTWSNLIEGQANLMDRWAGVIDFTDPTTGKAYALGPNPAVLMVRPRGWHLPEAHVTVDGAPMSGSLFDFGVYLFHCAAPALAAGSGPYFYLPKLESAEEARLWNDVFVHAQAALGLPRGTIKATVLIETLPAAFQMEAILHELREHVVGLNCGRWDYIFSAIKTLGGDPDWVTPDRGRMVMGEAFLRAYSLKLIATCHRRGAFAMGGMAAQIPVKGDPAANEAAFARVRADKEREAADGHDGTWVAHPDMVPLAMEMFDRLMPTPNQLHRLREDVDVSADDMLRLHDGERTEGGLRENVRVGIRYIAAWLGGRGAVPLYNLMEDAATAEICRMQLWQWRLHRAELADGRQVSPALLDTVIAEEVAGLEGEPRVEEAAALFHDLVFADDPSPFLTLPAYERLL